MEQRQEALRVRDGMLSGGAIDLCESGFFCDRIREGIYRMRHLSLAPTGGGDLPLAAIFGALLATVQTPAGAESLPPIDVTEMRAADLFEDGNAGQALDVGRQIYENAEAGLERSRVYVTDAELRDSREYLDCFDRRYSRAQNNLRGLLNVDPGELGESVRRDCTAMMREALRAQEEAQKPDLGGIIPDECVDDTVTDEIRYLLAYHYRPDLPEAQLDAIFDRNVGVVTDIIALYALETRDLLQGEDIRLDPDGSLASPEGSLSRVLREAKTDDKHQTILDALVELTWCAPDR